MQKVRRVFPYTLSSRDYRLWKHEEQRGRKQIEVTACKRARVSGRNVALLLSPAGDVLAEVKCG